MKPIMSFWSKPFLEGKHNNWINEDSFQMSWTISVNSITQSMSKPTLYTDKAGRELLVDKFGLDFAEVIECMSELDSYDTKFNSLSRYLAMTKQDEAFCHMDYDFFLWNALPQEITSKPVFFQSQSIFDNSRDDDFNGYQSPMHRPEEFAKEVGSVPAWWSNSVHDYIFRTYSCSIIGGSDINLLHKIANAVLDMSSRKPSSSWEDFDRNIRRKYPEDALLKEYGSIASYTVSEFVPQAICMEEGIAPTFLTNEFGMNSVQFTHVSFAKYRNEEIHGMLIKRILKDFDTEDILKRLEIKTRFLPKVTIVIIPDETETLYDCVLRSIVPRKQSPDETIVIDNGIKTSDRKFLDRIENIKIYEASPALTHMELMRNVSKEATGDIVIFIDSHIKVPRLYIEKSIAATLQYPNAVFCAATNDFQDQDKNTGYAYGATFDGSSPAKPVMSNYQHDHKLISKVDCLYSGLYIMPKELMQKAFELPHSCMEYLSSYLLEHDTELRCIENLLVSQNFKRVSKA